MGGEHNFPRKIQTDKKKKRKEQRNKGEKEEEFCRKAHCGREGKKKKQKLAKR